MRVGDAWGRWSVVCVIRRVCTLCGKLREMNHVEGDGGRSEPGGGEGSYCGDCGLSTMRIVRKYCNVRWRG